MTINAPAAILLLLYELVAKKQGIEIRKSSEAPSRTTFSRNTRLGASTSIPPSPLIAADDGHVRLLRAEGTGVEYHFHLRISHSGGRLAAVQEIAFTLANGLAYIQAALYTGMHIDAFAPRMSFFFVGHYDCSRKREVPSGSKDLGKRHSGSGLAPRTPRRMMLRFHTQTAGVSFTAQQPITTWSGSPPGVGGGARRRAKAAYELVRRSARTAGRRMPRHWRCAPSKSWRKKPGSADTADPLAGSYLRRGE